MSFGSPRIVKHDRQKDVSGAHSGNDQTQQRADCPEEHFEIAVPFAGNTQRLAEAKDRGNEREDGKRPEEECQCKVK